MSTTKKWQHLTAVSGTYDSADRTSVPPFIEDEGVGVHYALTHSFIHTLSNDFLGHACKIYLRNH